MREMTSLILLLALLMLGPSGTAAADPADDYAIRFTESTPLGAPPAAHLARNPAQGFDAWIAPDGVRIKPHEGDWQVRLELLRVGRQGSMRQVESAGVEAKGTRAELHRGRGQHGSLVEWYVNDEKGLEQGFVLHDAPASRGDGPVVLELALGGDLLPLLAADGQRVNLLRSGSPLPVLVYGSLAVVDAEGRGLSARMEVTAESGTGEKRLRIVVTDQAATYPLTVDPLMTTAAWTSADFANTQSVAWGDWDGDGDLDLAAGNTAFDDDRNRVYENTGGILATAWISADSDWTWSVAWGDWDGDGDLDLAAGNFGLNRVYENTGSNLASIWTSTDSYWTFSVAWGDWDNDGDLDLAAGNIGETGGPNLVYENNGGTLAIAWSSTDSDNTYSMAWGDWDGDGDLDLAAGNYGQPDLVYENTGGNLATAWASVDSGTGSAAWGDWDGDGDFDLAAGNYVYENTDGDFAIACTFPGALSAAWGDWDGDGDLDLAVGNRVYENTAGCLNLAWTSVDSGAFRVAWGDWDGDGDLDLAAAGQPSRVYENTGHALASAWTSNESESTASMAWGDWDGDGDLDLAAGNWRGQLNRVYENTGSELVEAWISAEADWTESVSWGDWDGDGDLDLAVGNYTSQPNRVYKNTGGDLVLAWTSDETDDTGVVVWGDGDGDGDLDLAVGNYTSQPNRIYENTGGALDLTWTSTETDSTLGMAWGDWDGDGDLDLAVGNWQDQPNRVYENTGGDFSLAWTSDETDGTVSVAWGDWDGDGDLDLAVGNWQGQPNRVYENQGGVLTLAWTSIESDDTWNVAWGDWDGDGDLDLAVVNGLDSQDGARANRVYENIGGDLALAWTSTEIEISWGVAWADWDSDGDLDLAVGNDTGEPTRVYENGVLNRPGRLPETPTSPIISQRPGTTDAAFFHSAEQCLHSPVIVPYDLVDEEGDSARRILPQYSLAGGGQWLPATEGPGGDGTEELTASAGGQSHIFVWNALVDGVSRADSLVFRITVPYQASTRLAGPIQRAAMSATSPPFRMCNAGLWLPDLTQVGEGETVAVPVNLTASNEVIASVAFSLDYDETCLDPDVDDDGTLDQYTVNVPADLTVTVHFDELDADGEIDVSIADLSPPIATITDSELLSVTFAATCEVTPPSSVDAVVAFSSDPVATLGDHQGQDVEAATNDGVVRIWPGPRGDCNSSDALGAPDLTAIVLEIFDGDGDFWLDAVNPTFSGSPVGCDANASKKIDAADVPCANRLIFGLECGGGNMPSAPSATPWVVVTGTAPDTPGEPGWIHISLEPNGAEVGSVALSLDLDPLVFELGKIDADSDGVPDQLTFPNGAPGMAAVSFDAADSDGELDLLLADLSMSPLADGVLLEIGLPLPAGIWQPPAGLSLSSDPPPSFGTVTGVDIDGLVYIGETDIFSDGFESGDTTAWLSMN